MTAALLRLGFRPFEVPVSYYSRSHAQGKKISWRDALVCLCILFRGPVQEKEQADAPDGKATEPKGLLLAPVPTQPRAPEQPDFAGPGARL